MNPNTNNSLIEYVGENSSNNISQELDWFRATLSQYDPNDFDMCLQITRGWITHRQNWSKAEIIDDVIWEHLVEVRTIKELKDLKRESYALWLENIDITSMLIRIETWEKIFNGEIDIKKYILDNNLTPDEYDPEYDISKLPFISLIIYKLNYKNLLQFINKTFINILIILKNLILNFYKIYLSLIILIYLLYLFEILNTIILSINNICENLNLYNTYMSKELIDSLILFSLLLIFTNILYKIIVYMKNKINIDHIKNNIPLIILFYAIISWIMISNVCLDSTNLINESTSNSSLFKDIKDFISNLISMNPIKINSSSISPLPSPNKIEVVIVSNDEISKIISETNNSVIPFFLSFVKNNLNNPRILKFIKTICFVLILKFIKNYESLFEWLKFLPVLISSVLDLSIIDVIKSKYYKLIIEETSLNYKSVSKYSLKKIKN